MGRIMTGWAQRDITPAAIAPEELGDRITAAALAISNGSGCVLMVSADLPEISAGMNSAMTAALQQMIPEFPVENLLFCATGAPAAAAVDPLAAVEGCAAAAVEAWRGLAPGMLAWGVGQAAVGYAPDGAAADPLCAYLFTSNESGRTNGAAVDLPLPADFPGADGRVTAGFWRELRDLIRSRFGGLWIMPLCSRPDTSPCRPGMKEAELRRRRLKFGDRPEFYAGEMLRLDLAERLMESFTEVRQWAQRTRMVEVAEIRVESLPEGGRMVLFDDFAFAALPPGSPLPECGRPCFRIALTAY